MSSFTKWMSAVALCGAALGLVLLLREPARARPKPPVTEADSEPETPAPAALPAQPAAEVRSRPAPTPRLPASAKQAQLPAPSAHTAEAPFLQLFDADRAASSESWALRNAMMEAFQRQPRSAVTVEAMDCRFRLCRMSLLFDSVESDKATLDAVFVKTTNNDYPLGFGAVSIPERVKLPDGRVRATVYVAREGELAPPRPMADAPVE